MSVVLIRVRLLLPLCFVVASVVAAFRSSTLRLLHHERTRNGRACQKLCVALNHHKQQQQDDDVYTDRRMALMKIGILGGSIISSGNFAAYAEGDQSHTAATNIDTAAVATTSIEMKDFIDPEGLFTIKIPKTYFALRRSAKGDLPDEKTGKGRKGSSIFTAGDMGKAEVVAVERFPTRYLLEDNGIEATGSLATFPDIGEPAAVAQLLSLRRDRDKQGLAANTRLLKDSVNVSSDGKELQFTLRTQIEVQKPELLYEQYGVSELIRITLAKASLRANDGNLMAVFASALETDFLGADGFGLLEAVKSFQVSDQSSML